MTHPTITHLTYADSEAEERELTALIASAPELFASLKDCLGLIRRAQETLCTYLHPDSAQDDRETLNILLEMFDGPKQREIEGAARSAIAKAQP